MADKRLHPRMTITQILNAMQAVADTDYDGDLQNNMLKIFNLLSPDNKRTYLRKSLRVLWESQIDLAQQGFEETTREIVLEDNVRINPVEVAIERRTMAAVAPYEDRDFKGVMKYFAIVIFLALGFTVLALIFLVGSNGSLASGNDLFHRVMRVLSSVFSFI